MKKQILTNFKQPFSTRQPGSSGPSPISIMTIALVSFGFYCQAGPAQELNKDSISDNTSIKQPLKSANQIAYKKSKSKKIENLPNFHKVHSFLYRGGEPTNKGLDKLKDMGIKTLIDLRAPTKVAKQEKEYAESIGLDYINLPMSDKAPTKSQVNTLLETIDKGKQDNKPVFVHCQHGSDRTGCMVGIWRVTRDGWTFDDTYKEMRKYWFGKKYLKLKNAVKSRAKS